MLLKPILYKDLGTSVKSRAAGREKQCLKLSFTAGEVRLHFFRVFAESMQAGV